MSFLLFAGSGLRRRLISAGIFFGVISSVLIISGCKEEGSEFYIPPDDMQCIEYTKAAIEKRGESYAEYTDKGMESGEAVWVAGKKFDFNYAESSAGNSEFIFLNGYYRVSKEGKGYPGVRVRMRTTVTELQKNMHDSIQSTLDPAKPYFEIEISCKLGVIPPQEGRFEIEKILPDVVVGNISDYVVRFNNSLGFYEISDAVKGKGPDIYFLKGSGGQVEAGYPYIRCDRRDSGIGGGTCFAKIVPWQNIELRYHFPKAQLVDFARIYESTMNLIDGAYIKGEN